MDIKVGDVIPESRIYSCTKCKNIRALLQNERAPPCHICSKDGKKQSWKQTRHEILIRTKNIRKEFEKNRTLAERISDTITNFCGNIYFVYIHIIWFTIWLVYNILAKNPFDPFPFGFLTLVVSLEAILLATFILISQNRQGDLSEMRSELDYQTDLNSEKRTAEILALLRLINKKIKKFKK